MIKPLLTLCTLLVTFSAAELPAQIRNSVEQENAELRARIDRLESVVERLQADDEVSSSIPYVPGNSGLETSGNSVDQASYSHWPQVGSQSPTGVALPTFPTVNVTGFFQADAGWVIQDNRNVAAVGDVQDGADFRRARLAATGNVAENVGYMLEMDFGFAGRPSFMDVWGEIRILDGLQNVRFGQYRNPFGLDGLTSVKELTFIERGLPFAFIPFRQIGVMTFGATENQGMTWAVSGFRAPTDVFAANAGDNGGYGMASRVTALVIDGPNGGAMHIGGAYSVIDPSNNSVIYRNQPEFFLSDTLTGTTPFFASTGPIATDAVNLFGGEFAATSGAWHAQGEVVYAVVDRRAADTATFSGASVQTGWILTGEHRPYNRTSAILGRLVPQNNFGKDGACGAWEVAARWSYLDLNDSGINGGQLHDLTAGLNWYLNKNTKFQFNYIHAFLKSAGIGDSDADIIATRAQVDF